MIGKAFIEIMSTEINDMLPWNISAIVLHAYCTVA